MGEVRSSAARTGLTKRQRAIRQHLQKAGLATTREIAQALGMNVNGVSQSLGALQARGLVQQGDGRGSETAWALR